MKPDELRQRILQLGRTELEALGYKCLDTDHNIMMSIGFEMARSRRLSDELEEALGEYLVLKLEDLEP